MKIDFESRLMPNVKFKLFPLDADEHERKRIFNIVKELPNFPVLYFGYRTNFNGSIIYNGFKNQEAMDNYDGNAQKEVSIYEAIPKLIPDGMRYNKELDKLVPDVITDFKPKEKSMCDWVKEIYKINFVAFDDVEHDKKEILNNLGHGHKKAEPFVSGYTWQREDNGGNHIAADGTPFDTIEEALNHNYTLIATSSANEYCSGIKVEFEKVLEYSEEILQRENGFIKADKEKINFSLVDPYAYEDLGKCLTIGAKKYSPDNWKLGDIESYIAALDRHLIDIKKAVLEEDKSLFIDKDTTLQHGANLMCNAMFIHYFIRKEIEKDAK